MTNFLTSIVGSAVVKGLEQLLQHELANFQASAATNPDAAEAFSLAQDLLNGDFAAAVAEVKTLVEDPQTAAYVLAFAKALRDQPKVAGETLLQRAQAAIATVVGAKLPATGTTTSTAGVTSSSTATVAPEAKTAP